MQVLGGDRLLADVSDEEVRAVLLQLWDEYAPATWNRNMAAISSWLTCCQTKKRWPAPSAPAEAERRKETPDEIKAVAKSTIRGCCRAVTSRSGNGPCGECCMRRRPEPGILALNVEDLDLENRQAPIRSKGGALEWVFWDSGTAYLLPRLDRTAALTTAVGRRAIRK
ncbi:hypothetical protein [Pseudonocardia sp.]|uniref:hypothetical protein n=1 Tax=Pseudonocardia sp. TaxID=60912 RepID=UPI0031FD8615